MEYFLFLMWAVMLTIGVAQAALDYAYRKLKHDHERLSRVTLYALRDLKWSGIKETEHSIMADANPSAQK